MNLFESCSPAQNTIVKRLQGVVQQELDHYMISTGFRYFCRNIRLTLSSPAGPRDIYSAKAPRIRFYARYLAGPAGLEPAVLVLETSGLPINR